MMITFAVALLAVAAKWISGDTAAPEKAAPMMLREFRLEEKPAKAELKLAVAGWCEVYVNGTKAGTEVLSPVTHQPELRTSELTFDVGEMLKAGDNRIEVMLGNGWQNPLTITSWKFHLAPWLGSPRMKGRLTVNGNEVLVTDGNWKAYDSPVIFDQLRNGEWYDARLEGKRRNLRKATVEKFGVWGCVSPDDAAPCREFETFIPLRQLKAPDGDTIYDFGANIAGWCEIDVKGKAGAKVSIDYDETLTPSNTLLGHVTIYIRAKGEPNPVQHDEYTLSGKDGGETWHPHFTFHGFRYAKVHTAGEVELQAIRARFVHSDFAKYGSLDTSDSTFSALQAATERSYLGNFVGFPTDCPHREKNGWTGDAQLAVETGLWNFDARKGYEHFLQMVIDAQRPSGAIPCILPYSYTFGFFWGSGPAWDAILFEIPWQLYRFYGDDSAARKSYQTMKRYLAFIDEKFDADGLIAYGLGDWCAPGRKVLTPLKLTDSAIVWMFNRRAAFWAERFGEHSYANERQIRAAEIRAAFNREFYKGDGMYGNGTWTSLAAPLYFKGLCAEGEDRKVAARLVESVRTNAHKVAFGILGAKWVPRVLSDYGHIDDAWRLFTQPEMPGWAHWLKDGDGTLREDWDDANSHNHIMFGDLSAWAYEYVGGIVPMAPGFRKVAIRPHLPTGVDSFSVSHVTPHGEIKVSLKRENGKPICTYSLPEGIELVESEFCP